MLLDRDYSPRIRELFDLYEFNSLKRYISHVKPAASAETPAPSGAKFEYETAPIQKVAKAARAEGRIAVAGDEVSLTVAACEGGKHLPLVTLYILQHSIHLVSHLNHLKPDSSSLLL